MAKSSAESVVYRVIKREQELPVENDTAKSALQRMQEFHAKNSKPLLNENVTILRNLSATISSTNAGSSSLIDERYTIKILHKPPAKTSTERMREFRARKRFIFDNKNNIVNKLNMAKSSAERVRAYRERKRELPVENDTAASASQKMRELHAKTSKPHFNRDATIRSNFMNATISSTNARYASSLIAESEMYPKKLPKTAAQRMRECRARKKSNLDNKNNAKNSNMAKSSAEKVRTYPGKKQKLPVENNSASQSMHEFHSINSKPLVNQDEAIPSNFMNATISSTNAGSSSSPIDESNTLKMCHQKPAKTATQRMREFRARKKLKERRAAKVSDSDSTSCSSWNSDESSTTDCTLTSDGSNEFDTDFDLNRRHGPLKENMRTSTHCGECSICDLVFYKDELKLLIPQHKRIIMRAFPGMYIHDFMSCSSCEHFLADIIAARQIKERKPPLWRYMLIKMLIFPKTCTNMPLLIPGKRINKK